MRSKCTNARRGVLALVLIAAAPTLACGPFFPNSVLDIPRETLFATPVATFAREIQMLRIPAPPGLPAMMPGTNTDVYGQSIAADMADIDAVLQQSRIPAAARARLLSQYRLVREKVSEHAAEHVLWREQNPYWAVEAKRDPPPPVLTNVVVPSGLPPEFAGYLCGLLALHGGRTNEACDAWRSVLALPNEDRRHRSTWAAFMLGKAMLDTDRPAAIAWFRQVRQLRADGFADTLGLAASSLGWEALAELRQKNYERAVDLYLQQHASGDYTAFESLRTTAHAALHAGAPVLRRLAQYENARRVLTAYLVSQEAPPPEAARQWLSALEAASVRDVEHADRLAWLAYQAGDVVHAQRWLARARKDSPGGQWVAAKLLLRAGKLEEAAARLAAMVRQFPKNEDWSDIYKYGEVTGPLDDCDHELRRQTVAQINGERAILSMARGNYVDALDLLLRNGYWFDAAYVAERVLTTGELKVYVDQNWRQATPHAAGAVRFVDSARIEGGPSSEIRWLLGRRLARLGRLTAARDYLPDDLRPSLDAYAVGLQTGRDSTRPAEARAAALAAAARLARSKGMELLGAECEPDWHSVGGCYDLLHYLPITTNRAFRAAARPYVTKDERRRNQVPQADPDRRFHYRYTACDIAWEAAVLMPDESDATARFLCEAGSWIKNTDPTAASRFYVVLVKRCGKTDLGRAAAASRWFPPSPR